MKQAYLWRKRGWISWWSIQCMQVQSDFDTVSRWVRAMVSMQQQPSLSADGRGQMKCSDDSAWFSALRQTQITIFCWYWCSPEHHNRIYIVHLQPCWATVEKPCLTCISMRTVATRAQWSSTTIWQESIGTVPLRTRTAFSSKRIFTTWLLTKVRLCFWCNCCLFFCRYKLLKKLLKTCNPEHQEECAEGEARFFDELRQELAATNK